MSISSERGVSVLAFTCKTVVPCRGSNGIQDKSGGECAAASAKRRILERFVRCNAILASPRRDRRALGTPPCRQAIGHAGVAGAVGESRNRRVAAKRKIRG